MKTNRWGIAIAGVFMQLALGAVYAWSVFRTPLAKQFGWSISESPLLSPSAFLCGFALFWCLWLTAKVRACGNHRGLLYGLGVFLASFSGGKTMAALPYL